MAPKITDINELMAKFNARHKDKPKGEAPPQAPAPAPAPPAADEAPQDIAVNVEDVHVGIVVTMDADGVHMIPLKTPMDLELVEAALMYAVRRVQSARFQQDMLAFARMSQGARPSGLIVPGPQA